MRNYGRIETAAWQSTKLRGAGVEAKLLWAYLIACPHGNALGCFVLPLGYIAIDLELDPTVISSAVQTLSERGLIEYDNAAQLVRIVGWWGHNRIENGNVAKGIAKVLKGLPKSPLTLSAIADLERLGGEHFNLHIKPGLNPVQTRSNQVPQSDRTATEPPDTGYLIPESSPLPPKPRAEEKIDSCGRQDDDLEPPEFLNARLRIETRAVAGGFKQVRGIGSSAPRLKNQGNADREMAQYLAAHCGLNEIDAGNMVGAARDPTAAGHHDARKFVVQVSRDNKLGWFPGDNNR